LEDLPVEVLGDYPVGDEWSLRLYGGGEVGDFVIFDGELDSVSVVESGSISVLRVYNHSSDAVFIIPGTIIVGTSQDRIVRRPVIVPPTPEEPYEIPSYCVESRRSLISSSFRGMIIAPLDFRMRVLSHYMTQDVLWRRVDKVIDRILGETNIPRDVVAEACATRALANAIHLSLACRDESMKKTLVHSYKTIKRMEKLVEYSRGLEREIEEIRTERQQARVMIGLNEWIRRVISLCEWGLEITTGKVRLGRPFLSDLYGLLHARNRPKADKLDPLERIRLGAIIRRIVSIISKYTGLDAETISRHLEEYGLHYVLAKRTEDADVEGMTREIMEFLKGCVVEGKLEEAERSVYRVSRELDEIVAEMNRHLRMIEDLYYRARDLAERLREEALWGVRERICTPESFGIKYRENIIGYSLLRDGKIVCTEIMPTSISRRLWTGIFQSIILYIMYYKSTERPKTEPRTTREKLLDKYVLTINETTEKIQTKVTDNGKTIYYLEAYY